MVPGYADAAKWVYEQALTPLGWGHDGLIALTEVRHIRALAMGKVWEVAPQTEASLQESRGNFRTHEIHEFAGGVKPPSHPLIHPKLTALVNEINEVGRRIKAGPLAEILARTVIDNMYFLIPSIAGPVRFVPLESLADDEFNLVALKQAASTGRLDAVKGADCRYLSSREALQAYRESKCKREPMSE